MNIIKTMDNKFESSVASSDQSAGSTDRSTSASLTDQKGRRLVRGAAAFAPVVLTLRSGALAAASCTGARIVEIPTSGNFSATDTEICAPEAVVCPSYPTSGQTKVLTQPTLKINVTPTGTGEFTCKNPTTGAPYTGTVAILSSQAANSLV